MRASTGVVAIENGRATRTPWLGLLIWAFACGGLFLSLVARDQGAEAVSSASGPIGHAGEATHSVDLTPSLPSTSLVATIDHVPIEQGAAR